MVRYRRGSTTDLSELLFFVPLFLTHVGYCVQPVARRKHRRRQRMREQQKQLEQMKMNPTLYDVAREEDEAEVEDIAHAETLLAVQRSHQVCVCVCVCVCGAMAMALPPVQSRC